MKKFLGSLLTLLFVWSTVTPTVSCNKDKTNNKVLEPIKKHEITKNNLDEFFKIHNTFEYKGEFFFKDISEQTEEDNERIKSGPIANIMKYIISQIFGSFFNDYFEYIPSEYRFKAWKLKGFEGVKINKNYAFNFEIVISNKKNEKSYTAENLTLSFTETKQYDDEEWIKKYVEYLNGFGYSMWEEKSEMHNGNFPFAPPADWEEESYKKLYLTDDNDKIKKYISEEYTNIFSKDKYPARVLQWFYNEKKLRVNVESYKYLGGLPSGYDPKLLPNEGLIAKVRLIFSCFHDPKTKVEAEVEILMIFSQKNLGGNKLW